MIANIDKPLINEKIQEILSDSNAISQFKQVIDNRFVKVKFDLLLGKGDSAFEQYSKFNTNISANEILGVERDITDDMYEYLMDMINKNKGQGRGPTKK